MTNNPQAKVLNFHRDWSCTSKKKREQIRGCEDKKKWGKFGREKSTSPARPAWRYCNAARSFTDHATGVGGTGVRSRRCLSRSGSRSSSAGYTEAGIGKIILDIMITTTASIFLSFYWPKYGKEDLGPHAYSCLLYTSDAADE